MRVIEMRTFVLRLGQKLKATREYLNCNAQRSIFISIPREQNLHNTRQKFEWNSTSISLPLNSKRSSQHLIFCSKSNTHPSESKCALHQPHPCHHHTQHTSYTAHRYPRPRGAKDESRSSQGEIDARVTRMSDPCVRAVSDEQVLGPNRYLESEERAKAFKAPVMMAVSEVPIFHKRRLHQPYTQQRRSEGGESANDHSGMY